jgi:hypothetical protein
MKRLSMATLALLLAVSVGCGGQKQVAATKEEGNGNVAKIDPKQGKGDKKKKSDEKATLRLVVEIDPEGKKMALTEGSFQVTSKGKAVDPATFASKPAEPAKLSVLLQEGQDKNAKDEIELSVAKNKQSLAGTGKPISITDIAVSPMIEIENSSNLHADFYSSDPMTLPNAVYAVKSGHALIAKSLASDVISQLMESPEIDLAKRDQDLACEAFVFKVAAPAGALASVAVPRCAVVASIGGAEKVVATIGVDNKITTKGVDVTKIGLTATGSPYAAVIECIQTDADLLKGKTKKPVSVEFVIRTKIKGGIKVKAATAA